MSVRKSLSILALSVSFGAMAVTTPVEIKYLDDENAGVNDPKMITLDNGTEVSLGQFRKDAIEHVARAVSLQFNTDQTFYWDVKFQNNAGYDALTLGPVLTEVRAEVAALDPTGSLEAGRNFPKIIIDTLTGTSGKYEADESYGETMFADYANNPQSDIVESSGQPEFYSIVYHELVHYYGFTESSCLGDCIPERSSTPSHMSKGMWYHDHDGGISAYDSASLDEKEEAGMSIDGLLYLGSDATQDAADAELAGGSQIWNSQTYLEMFATPTNGKWDGQVGGHLADSLQPAQLMRSSAARVQDMGMAAFMLCDMGWCRGEGQVIDLQATATLDENASDETTTYINVTFTNNTNAVVDKVKAQVRLDAAYTDAVVESNDICSADGNVLSCEMTLSELSEEQITISVGALQEAGYSIEGEVYSNDYDVDRNGFNNILDATLNIAEDDNSDNGNSDDDTDTGNGNDSNTDTGTTTPTTPEASKSKSGGSMSYWMALMLGAVAWRRKVA
ncbi:MAG: hypothetical protein CL840_15380 [Crocinitomicaceae bacterium]|nr:hypothetical protein [Crocinitomicaceae bacterium]|tara:strand:+ start:92969 stop:94483 length:1515 start_codon:yes stop_codon:yes gene_type:complete